MTVHLTSDRTRIGMHSISRASGVNVVVMS